MRLVCDKCSSVYTIEDTLVGTRDFSVSCKECGAPIVVRSARQMPNERPGLPTLSGAPAVVMVAPKTFAPTGSESWFVKLSGKEEGPFAAAELSRMLEQGRIDWATPIWREGLKDWRPARRDAVLVTAVAGARGHAGDTVRLDSARSFIAPEDTIVDSRPVALQPSTPQTSEDLLSSNSETQALDMRDVLPGLKPSERPQAWSSPQNQAFRAGLGMPSDSIQLGPAGGSVPARAARTLADAFRSAPSLMRALPHLDSTAEVSLATQSSLPVDADEGWMPKPKSMLMVALLAFSAGLIAAALYGYFKPAAPGAKPRAAITLSLPKRVKSEERTPPRPPPSTESLRDLPDPEELRSEVREVAPLVRRCVLDPVVGVDVDIYLDGPSGRVRDVQVRAPVMPPGRVQCINHAVRQMQLQPFTRAELKLMHKFSW